MKIKIALLAMLVCALFAGAAMAADLPSINELKGAVKDTVKEAVKEGVKEAIAEATKEPEKKEAAFHIQNAGTVRPAGPPPRQAPVE